MTVYKIKRIYEDKEPEDGLRVLVDRLWSRGMSKPRAALDHWMKDIAPSDTLRIAYHAGELDFEAFAARYRAELESNLAIEELRALAAKAETVTLLYAARDETQNHAQLLGRFLTNSDQTSP